MWQSRIMAVMVGVPVEQPTAIIYPDIPDNWRTRVDMQWPVYTFGRFESMERAARSEAAAAGKDVATFTADVRLDAARAFWALVTATESVRVVEEALALPLPVPYDGWLLGEMDRFERNVRELYRRLAAG